MKRIALFVVALAACGTESIDLTNAPVMDASPPGPVRCSSSADCPSGTYCETSACGATSGTCALFPAQCTTDEDPVCGCDRMTYFNDCIRRASGVSASTPGPCPFESRVPCGGKNDAPCPQGASCARLSGYGGPCSQDALGSCWVLPPACPTPKKADRWNECRFFGERCVDTCTAIRSGAPHYRAWMCPP